MPISHLDNVKCLASILGVYEELGYGQPSNDGEFLKIFNIPQHESCVGSARDDGVNWFTPAAPLLEGTQRAKLINEGVIQPKALYIQDIPGFKKFKCINAMLYWDTAVEYEIDLIRIYFP